MTFVLGPSSLVWLARIGRFDALSPLDPELLVATPVYDQLIQDAGEGIAEARRVQRARDADLFRVTDVADSAAMDYIRENPKLGSRDAATLALAHDVDGVAVLDEEYTRRIARVESVGTRGTVYLLLFPVQRGNRPPSEALDLIEALLSAGWRPGPKNYASVIQALDGMS